MLHLPGFFATFVIGGLTGVMVAVVPFDWQVHDTAFVTAHLLASSSAASSFRCSPGLLLAAAGVGTAAVLSLFPVLSTTSCP